MRLKYLCLLAIPAVLLGVTGLSGFAQVSRIGELDAAKPARISGSLPLRAASATDLGAMEGDRLLTGMSLRFAMSEAQQTALAQLLTEQQDPRSAHYHQWITPEEFGARFGLPAADLAKASAWLKEQGFAVTEVGRSGTFVRFSGTVAQVQRAFHTEMHRIAANGETHFANQTEAMLPEGLAGVTSAVTGLNDFHPQPHHRERIVTAPVTGESQVGVKPAYTSSSSGSHYLAPGDFYTIYDENALIASGTTGAGVTLAVVGQTDIHLADIAAFRSASGLAANAPTIKLYGADPGYPSNSDLVEAELDVEWAGATAPGANILYVNSTDAIDGSLTQAIDNNLAPVIAVSYGECESMVGLNYLAYYSQLLQMAAAQGISIVAASGDSGATDCDSRGGTASSGLAVDFPASSPLVTGVGGTEFNDAAGNYWSAANGPNSGSALSYIPEVVWNDNSSSQLSSSGGGRSLYFAKPIWQTGTGVPADFSRDVPDVSLNASPAHDGYLICTPGYCVNGYRDSGGFLDVVGGTSVSAPSFAGLLALTVQKTGGRLGNANPVLYALANSTYAGNVFHDAVSGTNASPCVAGSTDCGSGTPIGYTATANYDLATGWGSVSAFNMVNDWKLVTPATVTTGPKPTYTNVSGTANSVTAGTTVTLTATVVSATAAATTVPSGSVQFTVDNLPVGPAAVLSASGSATYPLSTTALASGRHTVQATYLGDTTYSGSKGAFLLNVASGAGADFTLTPATVTITVASGKSAQPLTLTVSAVNGFTGSVQFTASSATTFNAEYSFNTNPVVLTTTATSGTTQLTLFAYTSNAQSTQGRFQSAKVENSPAPWFPAGAGMALAGVLCATLPRKRRLPMLFVMALSLGSLGISGCSPASSPRYSNPTTPTKTGTYTVLISGTATINGVAVTHSSTITFVVQ